MNDNPSAATPPATDIVATDIAHRAMLVSEARYRRLFETAYDGILLINAETAQIEDVNPYLMNLLNYSKKEFMGKKLWDIGPFKDIVQTKEMFLEVQRNGYVRYDDLPLKTSTDDTIEVEFISNLYDVGGVKVIQCNIRDISERKAAEAETLRHSIQLKIALTNTIEVVTDICEIHDAYTVGHEKRVAQIAKAIGAKMGLDKNKQEGLLIAGSLHDVGKIGVPLEILAKPGKIKRIEYQLIKAHTQMGYEILHRMSWPWPVAEVALQHHERMDGSGYPHGLKGDAILLESRIMAVADVVEAMSSHRPYRAALGINKALAEIELGRGTKYDANVVDACLTIFRKEKFQIPT